MKKQKPVNGVYTICRSCGCDYVEEKSWLEDYPRILECPLCGNRVGFDS